MCGAGGVLCNEMLHHLLLLGSLGTTLGRLDKGHLNSCKQARRANINRAGQCTTRASAVVYYEPTLSYKI